MGHTRQINTKPASGYQTCQEPLEEADRILHVPLQPKILVTMSRNPSGEIGVFIVSYETGDAGARRSSSVPRFAAMTLKAMES